MSDPEDDRKERVRFWRLVATTSSLGWSMVLPIVEGMPIEYMYIVSDAGEVDWAIDKHIISRAKDMVVLDLPPKCPDEVDTVVAMEVEE